MADAFTPVFHLTQPEVGASRDTWGAKLNSNMAIIDTALQGSMPIGGMIDFGGANAPPGWLLADGSLHSISLFPKLFAVVGNRWGGDGVSNFATPDSRCRTLVGVGSNIADALGQIFSYALGGKGGANGQVIGQANLPNYQLPMSGDGAHQHSGATDAQGLHAHNGATDGQGEHAHWFDAYQPGPPLGAGGGPPGFALATHTTQLDGLHYHNVSTDTQGSHEHNIFTWEGQGGHYHTVTLGGSGQPLRVVTMYLAVTKIIYAGASAGSMMLASAPAPAPMLAAPMRGNF